LTSIYSEQATIGRTGEIESFSTKTMVFDGKKWISGDPKNQLFFIKEYVDLASKFKAADTSSILQYYSQKNYNYQNSSEGKTRIATFKAAKTSISAAAKKIPVVGTIIGGVLSNSLDKIDARNFINDKSLGNFHEYDNKRRTGFIINKNF